MRKRIVLRFDGKPDAGEYNRKWEQYMFQDGGTLRVFSPMFWNRIWFGSHIFVPHNTQMVNLKSGERFGVAEYNITMKGNDPYGLSYTLLGAVLQDGNLIVGSTTGRRVFNGPLGDAILQAREYLDSLVSSSMVGYA